MPRVGRIQHVRLGAAAIRPGVVVEVPLHQHVLQHVAVCFRSEAQERLLCKELRKVRRRQRGQPHPLEPQLALRLLDRVPSAAHLVFRVGRWTPHTLGVLRGEQLVRGDLPRLVPRVQLLHAGGLAASVRAQILELGAHVRRFLLPLAHLEQELRCLLRRAAQLGQPQSLRERAPDEHGLGWCGKQVSVQRFRFLAQCIDTRRDAALVVFRERDSEKIDVRMARDVACEHVVLEIGTLGRSTEILLQPMQLGTACAHALAQAFGPCDINLADGGGDTRCPTLLRGLDSI